MPKTQPQQSDAEIAAFLEGDDTMKETAAAMGVGLPPIQNTAPGEIQVHEAHVPDLSRVKSRKGTNTHYRWVAHDDRDRFSNALEAGYRPVKASEAEAAGQLRGHVGADGFQHWGRDLILMQIPQDKWDARQAQKVTENKNRLRRSREQLKEDMREVGGSQNVVGSVKVDGD